MLISNIEEGEIQHLPVLPPRSPTYIPVKQEDLLKHMKTVPESTGEKAEFYKAWKSYGRGTYFILTMRVMMPSWNHPDYDPFLTVENSHRNRAIKFWGGVIVNKSGVCVPLYKDPLKWKHHKWKNPLNKIVEDAYDLLAFNSKKFELQIETLKSLKLSDDELGRAIFRTAQTKIDDRSKLPWYILGRAVKKYFRGKFRRRWDFLKAVCWACQHAKEPYVSMVDSQATFTNLMLKDLDQ